MKFWNQPIDKGKRKTSSRFLLFSLIIHLLLLFLFFIYSFSSGAFSKLREFFDAQNPKKEETVVVFHNPPKPKPIEKEKNPEAAENPKDETLESETPAELIAKRSEFGWQMPESSHAEHIEIPESITGEIAHAIADKAEITEEKSQEEQTLIKKDEEPEVKTPQEAVTAKNSNPELHDKLEAEPKKIAHFQLPEKEILPEADHTVEAKQQNQVCSLRDKIIKQDLRGALKENEKPKKRNILALTKGFIEKLDGEDGNDLIDRTGDKNKQPSFEELKFISYESKVNWALQASWKQNFARHCPVSQQLFGSAAISFVIDERGYVKSITLIKSSGHRSLDDMVIKNTKLASPFPPLPKHFGVKEYQTSRIINLTANRMGF